MTKRIVIVLVLLMAMPALVFAQQQPQSKPWAKLSNGVLTFWYGPKPAPPSQVTCTGCGKKIAWSTNYFSNCGAKNPKDFPVYNALDTTSHFNDWREGVKRPWYDKRKEIKKVVFETSFKQVTNIYSTEFWFSGMENLVTIVGMENLNTSNVTSMRGMFEGCYKLTSLDVTRFNTAKVTDMSYMFDGCSKLTSLDVTRFNTTRVTNMFSMFCGCSNLTSLDVTHFNTSKVKTMSGMFVMCEKMTTLDISSFDTRAVKQGEMRELFYGSGLKTIYVSATTWTPQRFGPKDWRNTLWDNNYYLECNAQIIKK